MKKYYVFVNCVGFHTYEVKAKNKADAIDEAERYFQCDGTEGEAVDEEVRLIQPDDATHAQLAVYYPAKPKSKNGNTL